MCNLKYLTDNGITVFATFLHTHLIGTFLKHYVITHSIITFLFNFHEGTAINVRHFRKNYTCNRMEELPSIDKNLEYDFDYQVNARPKI